MVERCFYLMGNFNAFNCGFESIGELGTGSEP